MKPTRRTLVALLCAAAACSGGDDAAPSALPVSVTAAPALVKADGAATVTVHVRAGKGPVAVVASRGTFLGTGTSTATLAAAEGDLTLVTCDQRLDPACWGPVSVTASDASLAYGLAQVTFMGAEVCDNGVPDAGNPAADCAAAECAGATCRTGAGAVGTCAAGACTCTPDAGQPGGETACDDARDNDCDGGVDCADAGCAGRRCLAAGGAVGACAQGACVCTPASAGETACGDGRDDDCDGRVDCEDADCGGATCATADGRAGACAGGTCAPVACDATETAEVSCANRLDDDCDGLVDCAEAACDGQACDAAAGARWACRGRRCTDLASGVALALAPARARIPADGRATTAVTVTLAREGVPAAGEQVVLTTTLGAFQAESGPAASVTVVTDGAGVAAATFVSAAEGGTAHLTARLAAAPVEITASVRMPALAQISAQPAPAFPVMGVRDSGWNEANAVTFTLVGDDGLAYPDGLEVHLEHPRLGGSDLHGAIPCAVPGPACSAVRAATTSGGAAPDTLGQVRATLQSGTVAGTLTLTATATAGGQTRSAVLQPGVPVVGARPSAGAFTLVCDPGNVEALAETDCGASLVDAAFTCVAVLQDRHQNMLGRATAVTFHSEASRAALARTTPDLQPGMDPPAQRDLGLASGLFATLGGYLPEDVAPRVGEPSVTYADACGTRTHNPRDGVVSVIAVADGEEAFTDLDGDGRYDAGEPFVDLPEPFVDADDDGQHDPGEAFVDVDGSGGWTAANGRWDALTRIWTQTVVVFTGPPLGPTAATGGAGLLGTRWAALPAAGEGACTPTPPAAPFALTPGDVPSRATYAVYAADVNLNLLPAATSYAVAVRAPSKIAAAYRGLDAYPDGRGLEFTYQPCNAADACGTRCPVDSVGPCRMVARLGGFTCGVGASVTLTAGKEADPYAPSEVDWIVDSPIPLPLEVPVTGTSGAAP
ncbi:MopE-related protein [Anaeromyxobacter dehalogenans]|uniref:LigA n=1 Tax=Anaeromyxobacter dehalogenans (strain 2CP-C) TaxID=290397 RepID=Q2IFP7_ANADE|nr:MopE-related protein [Anaeromyxobacter dehalogenans]ABC83405.1 LigA [Anaeromyxobacter dehalogenans 2CP-C]